MEEVLQADTLEYPVILRRSARAKRLSLRVSNLDGRVTMTVPRGVSLAVARAFAEEKANWIARAVGRCFAPVDLVEGAVLPIEGVERTVVLGAGRAAQLSESAFHLPMGREAAAAKVFLKHMARERLGARVAAHAYELGRDFGKITLRDTRSRWGSCTSDGNLMFSWRLIMAPRQVLDYVAAHEVAHLQHMDHSPAFWSVVEELCPDFNDLRKWLRTEGNALHRYQFD